MYIWIYSDERYAQILRVADTMLLRAARHGTNLLNPTRFGLNFVINTIILRSSPPLFDDDP